VILAEPTPPKANKEAILATPPGAVPNGAIPPGATSPVVNLPVVNPPAVNPPTPPSPVVAKAPEMPTVVETPTVVAEVKPIPDSRPLLTPPSRLMAAAPKRDRPDNRNQQPQSAQNNKNGKGKGKGEGGNKGNAPATTTVEKPSRPVVVTLKEPFVKPEKGAKVITLPGSKGRPKVELQRPKSPQPEDDNLPELLEFPLEPTDKNADDGGGDDDVILELAEKPKLKRPTPPAPPKRTKWEEEEEEERAIKAKAAAKTKRRPQVVEDDDEEELGADGNPIVNPALVSISIARPPKPKSMMATKTAAAPVANRPKKPTAKGEGSSSSSRNRNDRRDRKEVEARPESIVLSRSLTVRDLADLLKVAETDIIRLLFQKGIAVQITQTLEEETARLVADEFGVLVESEETLAAATKVSEMLDVSDLESLVRRPPVVTIMGHVDHGKTTLLDSIRKTKVAQGEAGGITQHIGAYHVDLEHNGKAEQIVFLDTPGHEAFTAMRARGARVTDIAILVVAADDGVQPQTREAYSHAKAAGVPIIVAINKVDKPDSNPDRIKQELSELGLLSEEWGGETIMVPVSALKGDNLDTLLDMVLLVSEVEELSANPDRLARGTVIEANLDRTRGPVATLLVQNGTLKVGDVFVAGAVLGKIRAMIGDRGNKVDFATPSFAVEVLGLNEVPAAGDEFEVYSNEKEARAIAEQRAMDNRHSRLQQALSSRRVSLSTLSAQAQEGELKELNLILKADVQGSVEAILGSLQQLPQNEVQIRTLLAAPGEITETDVDLAAASGAVVVGFNTTLASGARAAADREGVDVREYDIIYKLFDDIQGAMEGLLDPEEIESPLGQAEVRAVFAVGRGAVAGCYVLSGKIIRNRNLRVRRGKVIVYQGTIDSLKRMKEDSREVNAGYECG
ncbi:MAG: translation initiation factor IF-2, partial [Microcystaceae cyanobacterium]